MFGTKTDRQLDELFLPTHLMEGVSNTQTANGSLALPAITINKSKVESTSSSVLNNFYTFCAIIVLLLFFTGKRNFYVPFLVFAGLTGVFFCVVGLYSFHDEIMYNYNALLINPLFLVLLIFIYRNNRKWVVYTIYTCFACILAYIIIMINKPHLLLVTPLIVLITTILIRLQLKNKKLIP
jgi:peptidoglycan/LPS O-acetylase OafA/YrhL